MTATPKDANPANTSCHVQLLGVGSDTTCTAASALLFFDRARYLFNVGEGFQRFCVQHRVKMSKISGVLLTRLGPEAAGGLPGMLLTLADGAGGAASGGGLLAGVEGVGLDLYGPPGLRNPVGAFKTFVNVGELGLQVHETRDEESGGLEGGAEAGEGGSKASSGGSMTGDSHPFTAPLVVDTPLVAIHALTLHPSGSGAEPEAAAEAGSRKRGRLTEGEPVASRASPALASAYLCRLADVPGRFLPQKAASLGVPRGKAYGQLVRGESVTAANGQTVTPAEVCEPSTPGPVVLVMDCPSMAYFQSLRAQPDLERCLGDPAWAARLACVVHLAPKEVVEDERYASWASGFGERAPACQHLVAAAAGGARRPPMRSGALLQLKLHAVDPALFPLQASLACRGEDDGLGVAPRGLLAPGCATASSGASMLKYHVRPLPKRGLDAAECDAELDVQAELGAVEAEHAEVLAALRADVEAHRAAAETRTEAPLRAHPAPASRTSCRIVFLGTGAAVPSKYRNVSGTLVDCFERGTLLVDCGEGSYGQLQRQLGPAAADAALAKLHAVWISHIHADHHAGLPAVLAARARLSPAAEPLLVMAPRSLSRALAAYAGLAPLAFCWVDAAGCSADLDVEESAEASAHAALLRAACRRLGLRSLESFVVEHCAHACGLALVSRDGWKLVFSGDTRPCEAVVRAARDATLLVHEATFEDALRDEALAKRHSTTGEALDVAARAGVNRVALTHFSQRYPKVPTLGGADGERLAGIAFDLMTLNLADLERLPLLNRPLQAILADPEDVEAEE